MALFHGLIQGIRLYRESYSNSIAKLRYTTIFTTHIFVYHHRYHSFLLSSSTSDILRTYTAKSKYSIPGGIYTRHAALINVISSHICFLYNIKFLPFSTDAISPRTVPHALATLFLIQRVIENIALTKERKKKSIIDRVAFLFPLPPLLSLSLFSNNDIQ